MFKDNALNMKKKKIVEQDSSQKFCLGGINDTSEQGVVVDFIPAVPGHEHRREG